MLKLKMMLCVMMLPLVVVSFAHQSSLSVSALTTASGVDNAASRLADTAGLGLFHPQREADPAMQKQLEGTQKYINEQCR